jgi:hypothetical protein
MLAGSIMVKLKPCMKRGGIDCNAGPSTGFSSVLMGAATAGDKLIF